MATHALELRLDAPGADGLASALTEESARVRAAVCRKLGLRLYSKAWARLDLDADKGRRTLEQLIEVCGNGQAVAGTGIVYEHLGPEESADAEWSLLSTKTAGNSFSLWDDYPSYKPSEVTAMHAMNHTFVSESFVDACGQSKLRGIEFLRCQSRGRKPAPAWFAALPAQGLGHGLDHPWFDRRLWLQEVGNDRRKRTSSLDTGQHTFHQRWLRADLAAHDPFLAPLSGLFPMQRTHESTLTGLTFVTVPRYWTKALPDADFAYLPWGEDGPNRAGKLTRFRMLAVRRGARQALIAAGLFDETAFLAVRAVDTPEAGVEILDERYPPVPPMYSAEALAALRSRERDLYSTQIASAVDRRKRNGGSHG